MKNESIRYSIGTPYFHEFLIDRYDCITYNYEELMKLLAKRDCNPYLDYIGIYKDGVLRKVIEVQRYDITATINELLDEKIKLMGDKNE